MVDVPAEEVEALGCHSNNRVATYRLDSPSDWTTMLQCRHNNSNLLHFYHPRLCISVSEKNAETDAIIDTLVH
jgi:hypothetical protein